MTESVITKSLAYTTPGGPLLPTTVTIVPAQTATNIPENDLSTTVLYSLNTPVGYTPISVTIQISANSVAPSNATINVPSRPTSTRNSTTAAGGKGKIGGGPVAGIAIACFIAGVAIGCLLLFLIISRRNRRYGGRHASDGIDGRGGFGRAAEKSLASSTISIPQDSSAAIIENALPQPVEDNTIKTELSKLKDRVSDHIQSYYDLTKTGGSVTPLDIQQVLANGSSVSIENFSRLLADPKTRPAILRYGLAWVILSRVSLECDPSISLLPWHVVSCLHDMRHSKLSDRVRMAFFSKWRCITSTLLEPTYGQLTTMEADPRNQSVHKAVQVADIILRQYVDESADNAARLRNLEEIMKRAMRFAYTLFSHPSSWRFDWQEAGENVVVFPALLQLTNEDGAFLKSPRVFGEKVVMRA